MYEHDEQHWRSQNLDEGDGQLRSGVWRGVVLSRDGVYRVALPSSERV